MSKGIKSELVHLILVAFAISATIVAAILKLVGAISWSWWIVTLPIWLIAAIYTTAVIAVILIVLFLAAATRRKFNGRG